jgi:hypothetical protein
MALERGEGSVSRPGRSLHPGKARYPLLNNSGLRVFENRVLRRIFRLKREKVAGEWRKLHNEKLYYSGYQSKEVRWV